MACVCSDDHAPHAYAQKRIRPACMWPGSCTTQPTLGSCPCLLQASWPARAVAVPLAVCHQANTITMCCECHKCPSHLSCSCCCPIRNNSNGCCATSRALWRLRVRGLQAWAGAGLCRLGLGEATALSWPCLVGSASGAAYAAGVQGSSPALQLLEQNRSRGGSSCIACFCSVVRPTWWVGCVLGGCAGTLFCTISSELSEPSMFLHTLFSLFAVPGACACLARTVTQDALIVQC